MSDAEEQWAQLTGGDDSEVWVGVTFGAENKVNLKVPDLGEFEIDPHGIDEWLQQHGLRATPPQRSQMDAIVDAAIERGRQQALGGGGSGTPTQDATLASHWQSFRQYVQAVRSAAGGDDRAATFQALAQMFAALDQIEAESGGGRSCADEVSAWWGHYSNANEWDHQSVQQAAQALANGGDAAADWAMIQIDLREGSVILAQHQLMDASADWRQALQPVQTWGSGDGS